MFLVLVQSLRGFNRGRVARCHATAFQEPKDLRAGLVEAITEIADGYAGITRAGDFLSQGKAALAAWILSIHEQVDQRIGDAIHALTIRPRCYRMASQPVQFGEEGRVVAKVRH
jgi:hypothetical protein